jgi:hypothetical protein
MDKAGRLKLVKAMLSAIPIHQVLIYAKKTLKLIEKIKRGFLLAGRKEANGGCCHMNWNWVCHLKVHGDPCVVLIINDNLKGLMFSLSFTCRTCP